MLLLEKYPQIKKLFGSDPNFKWIVMGMILVQMVMILFVPRLSWGQVFILSYCFGGVINHSLMLGNTNNLEVPIYLTNSF